MDAPEFKQQLAERGFSTPIPGDYPANCFNDFHTHPFDVRGLITSGEMTLTMQGKAISFRPGEIFTMPVGVPHQENVGPDRVEYIGGRSPPG